jgi:lipopolysaccharide transport system ATP-binding protein
VLAVGDAQFQKKCLGKMEEVGRGGRTVLFVSHNMPAVVRLCSRAVLLSEGRVLRDGPSEEVVRDYLKVGAESTATRLWPDAAVAPGNASVRLHSVKVVDQATGQVSESIDIRHPIEVVIEYFNHANDERIHAAFEVHDENNYVLFSTGDYVNADWRRTARRFDGRVRSTCTIPGNFFAEGQLRLLVALVTHQPVAVLWAERDVVSFMVVDHSDGDGARGEQPGRFPGLVRPLLDWKVERLQA